MTYVIYKFIGGVKQYYSLDSLTGWSSDILDAYTFHSGMAARDAAVRLKANVEGVEIGALNQS